MKTVNAEVGGEPFLLRAHGALRVFALATEEVAAVGQGGPLGERGKNFVRGVLERTQELDIELFALGRQQSQGGLFAGVVFIAGVGRSQAAEVGAQMREAVGQALS